MRYGCPAWELAEEAPWESELESARRWCLWMECAECTAEPDRRPWETWDIPEEYR